MLDSFQIAERTVRPGKRLTVQIPVARLPTQTMVDLPVTVLHGTSPGPTVGVAAAIHGDEINGVEIIRQVLATLDPARLSGTLLVAPIVNVFGFIHQSRYLPDRRDLNRSFPGSRRGSLTSILAHAFLNQVVARCELVFDLHTAAQNRANLPQVRADLDDEATREACLACALPVMLHGRPPSGSLRRAANKIGVRTLVFEGGEALRFDTETVDAGVDATRRLLAYAGLIDPAEAPPAVGDSFEARTSRWVRAPRSGLARLHVALGDAVVNRQPIGVVSDPVGETHRVIRASAAGVVVGAVSNPIVNRGDAVAHIGIADDASEPDTEAGA